MSPTPLRALLLAAALGGIAIVIGSNQPASAAEPPIVRGVAPERQAINKYTEICQACHQATGLGLEGAFPPLAGSEWLNGNPLIPIAILLTLPLEYAVHRTTPTITIFPLLYLYILIHIFSLICNRIRSPFPA